MMTLMPPQPPQPPNKYDYLAAAFAMLWMRIATNFNESSMTAATPGEASLNTTVFFALFASRAEE